jgi:hypothetical protein
MKYRILDIANLLEENVLTLDQAITFLKSSIDVYESNNTLACEICAMYDANNADHGKMINIFCPCCQKPLKNVHIHNSH